MFHPSNEIGKPALKLWSAKPCRLYIIHHSCIFECAVIDWILYCHNLYLMYPDYRNWHNITRKQPHMHSSVLTRVTFWSLKGQQTTLLYAEKVKLYTIPGDGWCCASRWRICTRLMQKGQWWFGLFTVRR